jgi:pimeloyl-ACP methyl ester carboxylesterase
LTPSGGADHYWFPDYLADLDFLLDHYVGDQPVDLVGHSMGGNVAMLYAGVRPERIRAMVNLEGFGMPATTSEQAPLRYAKWMDELKALQRGELALKSYDSVAAVARRLMKTNPRLTLDKAEWLAQHWASASVQADGSTRWQILGDAAHKITNAQLYRVEEVQAAWQRITAPVLAVEARSDSLGQWFHGKYTLEQYHERLKSIANCEIAVIEDAGHMLHHDQPQQLAVLMERFLDRS